jgi:hypothetical protein
MDTAHLIHYKEVVQNYISEGLSYHHLSPAYSPPGPCRNPAAESLKSDEYHSGVWRRQQETLTGLLHPAPPYPQLSHLSYHLLYPWIFIRSCHKELPQEKAFCIYNMTAIDDIVLIPVSVP